MLLLAGHAAPPIITRFDTEPSSPVVVATAEATLSRAEMELQFCRELDDRLEDQLESLARDKSLPRALRARALVTITRSR